MAKRLYQQRYKILISNDDGIHATGLKILAKILSKKHQIVVFAPTEERSSTGHFITLHKPIRVYEVSKNFFGTTGGPSDCVNLALNKLIGFRPDFVISGINRGSNLGQDIFYSGTVSAAREAVFSGIPGIAISLANEVKGTSQKLHYESAAKVLLNLLKTLKPSHFPQNSYLNINVPNVTYSKLKGIEVSHQGYQIYSKSVVERLDIRGRKYYWIGGVYRGFEKKKGTDCYHVYKENKVSLTMHKTSTENLDGQVTLMELKFKL